MVSFQRPDRVDNDEDKPGNHVELRPDLALLLPGKVRVACGARATLATRDAMADDGEAAGAVSAPCTAHRPSVRHLTNLFVEEPDA
jgi:hypothetical protein